MTEDEIKALKAERQARLERAILPQGSGYARHYNTPPAPDKLPDWNYWKHFPKVEPWQACALALNINPNSLILTTDGMGAFGSGIVTCRGFPNNEAADRFSKLLQLLNANQFERQHFTENFEMGVRLFEFAAWCAPVVRNLIGSDIPKELAAMAKDAPQTAPAAKGEAGAGTTPGDDWTDKARAIADECFDTDTKGGCRDSLARKKGNKIVGGYSFRVMELMQERGIKGARGIIDNPATIMRDALQGDKWWANKPK